MSSNYRRNKEAVDQYRKELRNMLEDIREIDRKVINRAVNDGVAYAKRHTPVGQHPNPVTFTVKNGKDAGKKVSFSVDTPGTGGKLKESWGKLPTKQIPSGIETKIENKMDYAEYWNYGHRIVTKKGGPVKGFVKGTFVLEKAKSYVDRRLRAVFARAVEEVRKRHG